MAILKCKMCGGDIVLSEDKTCGTCEYCGSTMTFPRVSDEQRLNLFNRANHFRRQNEFDKAIASYERILDMDDGDAEAHWGAVLSRYGIEYVEDPVTHERIPTCHRAQLTPILSDGDYLAALEHAPDGESRRLYEQEARRIAEIQKGILAISSQEKPYDVFICYKETDDGGSRTKDSTLAQEIYYQLTNEGYKVFFSRITLEDKLGQQYEPYIFAALNTAKVMLVVGTKPEHFTAVWVKNEWSRYLALMKGDRSRLLIPCYRDMDPYDLPEELSALQSQDMGKIGFMQDLIRGVKKVLDAGKASQPAPAASPAAPGVASLHKRALLFLEDGDWSQANEYFDRILDIDPEYAPAYIGKVQAALQVRKEEALARCPKPLKDNADYRKALRFADEAHRAVYEGYNRAIEERLDLERREAVYREADALEKSAAVEADFLAAAKKYDEAGGIRDAKERAANCRAKAAAAFDSGDLETAYDRFVAAGSHADAADRADALDRYMRANAALGFKDYAEAREIYAGLGDFLDSAEKLEACNAALYGEAEELMEGGDVARAHRTFKQLGDYIDSARIASGIEADYAAAGEARKDGRYDEAIAAYAALGKYSDSADGLLHSKYLKAKALYDAGTCLDAAALYEELGDYQDSPRKAQEARYEGANALWAAGDLQGAAAEYKALGDYSDAPQQLAKISADIADAALAERDYASALTAYQRLEQTDEIRAKEYEQAQACYDEGHFAEAVAAYETLGQYELSLSKLPVARYAWADQLFNEGSYAEAAEQFALLGDMTDSAERANESTYLMAKQLLDDGEYDAAKAAFQSLSGQTIEVSTNAETVSSHMRSGRTYYNTENAAKTKTRTVDGYEDADEMVKECDYRRADALLAAGEYEQAQAIFESLAGKSASETNNRSTSRWQSTQAKSGGYLDSLEKARECIYHRAEARFEEGDYAGARALFASIAYSDSADRAKQCAYLEAQALYEAGHYADAEAIYATLSGYEDSDTRVGDCRLRQGEALMAAGDYEGALGFLEGLDHGDSADRAVQCRYQLGRAAQVSGDADGAVRQYAYAASLPEAREALAGIAGDYAAINEMPKAIQTLWLLRDDGKAQSTLLEIASLKAQSGEVGIALLAWCATGDGTLPELVEWALMPPEESLDALKGALSGCDLLPEEMRFEDDALYTFAAASQNGGAYDQAEAIFTELGDYRDAATQALESRYQKGAALYTKGDYAKALEVYSSIPGYRDVDSLLADDDNFIAAARAAYLAQFEVGNTVTFGHYEQDDNTGNGAEEIEWRVLANDGEKATLISVKALDCKPYNTQSTSVTWETCTLRKWLNGDFLNAAFTAEEQAKLEGVTVTANKNPKYVTDPGNDTQDRVFLLSIDEANGFFALDLDRTCYYTGYAKKQGTDTDRRSACWWWLRSPGYYGSGAAYVGGTGAVNCFGLDVNSNYEGVRPVVVLRLSSESINYHMLGGQTEINIDAKVEKGNENVEEKWIGIGTGEGINGDVVVEVEADATTLYSITVIEQNETPGMGSRAIENMPAEMLAANSISVDGITGATFTSNAIKAAVKDALSNAGIDPAAFMD